MNIRFSDDLLSDLRAIAGALRLLFLFGLGIILLFLIFYWDALCSRPFIEAGPTELVQTLFLVLSTALFFLEAHRRREMRGALVLTGGFIGCMLIRASHPCRKEAP